MNITLNPSATSPESDRTEPDEFFSRSSHILFGEKLREPYHYAGAMGLSLKWFFNGTGFYDVGAGHYAVDDHAYLILNHGQPYSLTIEANNKVGSLILFFEAGFAEEVYRSLVADTSGLLDDPFRRPAAPIHFVHRLYPHDESVSPLLHHLRAALRQQQTEQGWLREQLHVIMQRLLNVHQAVHQEIAALPAARAATREELYRRLHRAKDYIAACFTRPLTLNDMAAVACLSPNHFLRSFKTVFHQTPHQYLTALRLEHARRLLTQTDSSVTDICFAVGFTSLGSFSWLFRRQVGVSPDAFRKQKGDFREVRGCSSLVYFDREKTNDDQS
jgi:AraC-type DNA-binding domain-containing proteins